jgi:hypothetical protein
MFYSTGRIDFGFEEFLGFSSVYFTLILSLMIYKVTKQNADILKNQHNIDYNNKFAFVISRKIDALKRNAVYANTLKEMIKQGMRKDLPPVFNCMSDDEAMRLAYIFSGEDLNQYMILVDNMRHRHFILEEEVKKYLSDEKAKDFVVKAKIDSFMKMSVETVEFLEENKEKKFGASAS